MTETKWTTLPGEMALRCPAWASDETRQLAAEVAEAFGTTRAAREESERLKAEAGTIDLMQTNVCDLIGAAGMARQSQLEAWRDELLARSKFSEYLSALERDRARAERESADAVNQARSDAKQRLLDAGCRDLSAAVDHRGKPDETRRAAFDEVLNSFPAVGAAASLYREVRSMATALTERGQYNRRHRTEAERALRGLLESAMTPAGA